MENPWNNLPKQAPFVLDIDKPYLPKIKTQITDLRFDIRPEPYLGNLSSARIVLLLLNPGFEEQDIQAHDDHYFSEQNVKNLLHQSDPPFYLLNQKLSFSGGNRWWTKKLNGLVKEGFDIQTLAYKIMCIEFLPYHSVKYHHSKVVLPSQKYSFYLLENAMAMGLPIIVMRSEKIWLNAVPSLAKYPYVKLKNPQNPSISRNNMQAEQFDSVLESLKK